MEIDNVREKHIFHFLFLSSSNLDKNGRKKVSVNHIKSVMKWGMWKKLLLGECEKRVVIPNFFFIETQTN